MAEGRPQLVEGRRPGRAIRGLVDPAAESNWGVSIGKGVMAVNGDGWRPSEVVLVGKFRSVNDKRCDEKAVDLACERLEVSSSRSPTWAVLEVHEPDLHGPTVPGVGWV